MKTILLIGSNGQVGQELQTTLEPWGQVICIDRKVMDLAQLDQVQQMIHAVQPDLIVNAAAYTAVDRAETESDLAYAVNAVAPALMAEAAEQVGAALIHISTDYVFDGRKGSPYTEQDFPNPVSVYGQSKLAGEEKIQLACLSNNCVILRTAWVYGAYGKGNFVKTMLRLGAEREEIRVVCDQVGSPTWSKHLAQAITQIIPKLGLDISGIYHFTNSGVASWYDFAVAIFEEAEHLGFPLKVKSVIPITTEQYPTPAQRPAYSVLACTKLSALLGTSSPHWRVGLRQMLMELRTSPVIPLQVKQ